MKELGKIKDSYDFSFDARKLGLVLLGVFAVASLVFVLGVSVGLQWERKKAEGRQMTPTAAVLPKPAAPPLPAAPPVYKPVTAVPPPPVAPPVMPPEKTEASDSNDNRKEPVQDLTYPKVLTSNSKTTAPLTPEKKKKTRAGRYTVQLSAYNDEQSARTKAEKLKKKGFDARVYTVEGKRGGYNYKVHVGSFASRDEAVALSKKLKEADKGSPFVTSEN